jgi:hypothetical protein
MSFLKSKHSGWTWDLKRTPFTGGGGGGGQPTQTTAYNTNIPEYARPYVENMLQSTQAQIYNDDMTGFRPYQPYSSDVNNYFAGFSPLQQQAQQAAYNMQTPGQYDVASGLAGVSGLGAFGLGTQAAGAGSQFAMNATDPSVTQSYMSPYMQNVVDFQKQSALRDYQVAQPMRQAQAVAKGAFGGSRQAIENAEAQRNLNTQLQGIQATGTQKAFEDAQRQQQFGAQLGLQGLQTGLQGYGQAGQAASTLGQLGTAQFGAQKDIANLQSTMGAQQQALEQNKINQAIQDYAIQQQYPMMQLGFMSNMLRGLPMQAQTTQLYQAQPSALQQGVGLVGAAGTLFGGKAEGGVIEMAEGGIPGYKYGKLISEPKLEGMADNLSVQQLVERLKDPALTEGEREVFREALAAKQNTAARNSGIAAAGGGLFNTMGYAGGGILAFAGEGPSLIEDPQFGGGPGLDADQSRLDQIQLQKDMQQYEFLKTASPVAAERMLANNAMLRSKVAPAPAPTVAPPPKPAAGPAPAPAPKTPGTTPTGPSADPTTVKGLEAFMAEQERLMGPNTVGQGLEAKIAERLAGMDKRASQDERAAMRRAFVELGTKASPGGFLQAATGAIGTYGEASDAAKKVREGMDLELTKMQADIKKGERAEKRGNLDAAGKFYENAENRQLKLAEMQNQLKAAQISASGAHAANNLKREEKAAIKADLTKTLGREPTMAEILNAYTKATSVADESADARLRVAANTAYQKWEAGIVLDPTFRELQKKASKGDEAAAAKIEELKSAKRQQINAEIMGTQTAPAPAAAVPQPGPDGTINIPGKGTFKQLPNGNFVKV